MPGQRARQIGIAKDDKTSYEAVEAFTNHHIVAVRKRRSGEITQVKHAVYGWMPVKDYYNLQKAHEVVESPILSEIVRGGYQLKAWVWGANIGVSLLGFDANIPLGVILVAIALVLYAEDEGDEVSQFLDLACLVLPFGEFYYLYFVAAALQAGITDIDAFRKWRSSNRADVKAALASAHGFGDQLRAYVQKGIEWLEGRF